MSALPSRFYGDPVNCADEMRKITRASEVQAERDRLNKGRRIRALVKQVMKGVRR
jgi:hypothetical protein